MKLSDGFNLLATAPDGIKRLRELILSLAVQGKLVPQDPNDEPASELLKHIRAEKGRLMAEGKIKKDKPLSVISDDEKPFELPAGWEWVRFDELIDITKPISYGVLVPGPEVENGVPFVRIGDIAVTNAPVTPEKKIAPEIDAQYSRTRLEGGEILMGVVGSIGKLGIAPVTWAGANIARALCRITPAKPIQADFVVQLLQTRFMQSGFNGDTRTLAQPTLNIGLIRGALTPLPPLAEQSRIVAKVEELMALCDALETRGQLEAEQHTRLTATLFDALAASESAHQLQENWARLAASFDLVLDRPEAVDALEQTLLQLAVRGLLVPQDSTDEPASELLKQIRAEKDRLIAEGKIKKDKPLPAISDEEKPFELPQGWEWVRFDELIDISKPISYGVLVPGPDVGEGVPFIRLGDLSIDSQASLPEKRISLEIDAQYARTRISGGEVLMGVVGSIGKLGIAPASWAGANIARAICRIVPAKPVATSFMIMLLQADFMQSGFRGDTRTLAQPTLNIGLIRNAITPLPPLAEQSRIVACVEALRTLCGQLRERLITSQKIQTHLAETLIEYSANG